MKQSLRWNDNTRTMSYKPDNNVSIRRDHSKLHFIKRHWGVIALTVLMITLFLILQPQEYELLMEAR